MRYFFLFDPVFLPFSPLLSLAPGYVIIRTQLRRIEVFSYLVTRSEMGKQKSNMASCSESISWTKTLVSVPRFSHIQINQHLKDSERKDIGKKGHKFFVEKLYSRCICGSTECKPCRLSVHRASTLSRSQRKNEDPHSLKIEVVKKSGMAKFLKLHVPVNRG